VSSVFFFFFFFVFFLYFRLRMIVCILGYIVKLILFFEILSMAAKLRTRIDLHMAGAGLPPTRNDSWWAMTRRDHLFCCCHLIPGAAAERFLSSGRRAVIHNKRSMRPMESRQQRRERDEWGPPARPARPASNAKAAARPCKKHGVRAGMKNADLIQALTALQQDGTRQTS
jgi:hypothetical protein